MNIDSMHEYLSIMDRIDPACARRVRHAGHVAAIWAAAQRGITQEAFNAAVLAACELRCIVEEFHNEKNTGQRIVRKQP